MDTSALFKRYVEEDESKAVLAGSDEAPAVGTALITHVEVAAALAQAERQEWMGQIEAREAEREFLHDWDDFHENRCDGGLASSAAAGSRSPSPPSAGAPARYSGGWCAPAVDVRAAGLDDRDDQGRSALAAVPWGPESPASSRRARAIAALRPADRPACGHSVPRRSELCRASTKCP